MYPPRVDYRRPATVEAALDALDAEGARVLAGGHSLVPALKERATDAGTLVDVGEIDALRGVDRDDGATAVGACTTYADALDDGTLRERAPAVADALAALGDRQIRNRGTVGGNLVQGDPGADVPAAALAADASVLVRGPDGERTVAVEDLYAADAPPATDRDPAAAVGADELVTTVRVPDAPDGAAYERKTHPARGYATVGVAVRVWIEDGTVGDARIAATGVRRAPTRLSAAETALTGRAPDADAAAAASERAGDGLDPDAVRSDPNVSGAYRLRLLSAYAERAIGTAFERAGADGGGR